MFPTEQQIIEHYREVLEINDKQQKCLNPFYPKDEVPQEIAIHSLIPLQPLLEYRIRPKDIILDIGCGAGSDCFLAAYRGGHQVKVYGIDIVEELLTRANTLKAKYKLNNVSFANCSTSPIPFPNDSFDLVLMNYSFHLFQDKGQLLDEIHRVLKSGGMTVIGDSFSPKEYKKSDPIISWLYSAGGAISVEDFYELATSAAIEVLHFNEVDLDFLTKSEIIGYMVCRKVK